MFKYLPATHYVYTLQQSSWFLNYEYSLFLTLKYYLITLFRDILFRKFNFPCFLLFCFVFLLISMIRLIIHLYTFKHHLYFKIFS